MTCATVDAETGIDDLASQQRYLFTSKNLCP
jgi:hypothetical protein